MKDECTPTSEDLLAIAEDFNDLADSIEPLDEPLGHFTVAPAGWGAGSIAFESWGPSWNSDNDERPASATAGTREDPDRCTGCPDVGSCDNEAVSPCEVADCDDEPDDPRTRYHYVPRLDAWTDGDVHDCANCPDQDCAMHPDHTPGTEAPPESARRRERMSHARRTRRPKKVPSS